MTIGPFFIGEMIPSAQDWKHRYAGFFIHGLYFLDGEFVPLADTWLQGLHELIYSYIPLVVYLSFCCTRPSRLYFRFGRDFDCVVEIHGRIILIIGHGM
jgi:hypothetical protein